MKQRCRGKPPLKVARTCMPTSHSASIMQIKPHIPHHHAFTLAPPCPRHMEFVSVGCHNQFRGLINWCADLHLNQSQRLEGDSHQATEGLCWQGWPQECVSFLLTSLLWMARCEKQAAKSALTPLACCGLVTVHGDCIFSNAFGSVALVWSFYWDTVLFSPHCGFTG